MNINAEIATRLPPEIMRFNESLANYSTWRIGGNADVICEPRSTDEVGMAIKVASRLNIPWIVIGDGSNLLFSDDGLRGMAIRIGDKLSSVAMDDDLVYAHAGIWVPYLALYAGRQGLSGLEHTAGIPGRLGGLICMNGGSQRQCIGELVRRVDFVDHTGERGVYYSSECNFRYRHSRFQEETDKIIVGAEMRMTHASWVAIRRVMKEILSSRNKKFPRKLPNCGSVFKSDPDHYASLGPPGRILEECGFKGEIEGGAQVSNIHANFIVNNGGAKAMDVLRLIKRITAGVTLKKDVVLITEVKYVSEKGVIMPASDAVAAM
jgi:UDP-N-acetylmuramate dehydrogenase